MRRALLCLPLVLAACTPPPAAVSPPQARYTPPPGPYVPPYPDLLPRAAPASPPRPNPVPGDTEDERTYYVDHFAITDALRCRVIPRDEAVRLAVAVRLDRTRQGSVPDARRAELDDLAQARTRRNIAERAPCMAAVTRLVRALQAVYPAPRPSTPRLTPATPAPANTGPGDSGWQPARPAPAPLRPDQLDL